jgi:hypothetical protein
VDDQFTALLTACDVDESDLRRGGVYTVQSLQFLGSLGALLAQEGLSAQAYLALLRLAMVMGEPSGGSIALNLRVGHGTPAHLVLEDGSVTTGVSSVYLWKGCPQDDTAGLPGLHRLSAEYVHGCTKEQVQAWRALFLELGVAERLGSGVPNPGRVRKPCWLMVLQGSGEYMQCVLPLLSVRLQRGWAKDLVHKTVEVLRDEAERRV